MTPPARAHGPSSRWCSTLGSKNDRTRGRLCAAISLGFALLFTACARKTAPPPPPELTVEERSVRVARALEQGDGAAVASAMREAVPVRIEIRQVLTETDERAVTEVPDRAALRAWVERTSAQLRCDAGCRWPRGLVVGGPWTCVGQCCRLPKQSMTEDALYLVRVCFSAGDGAPSNLSLLELAEAR